MNFKFADEIFNKKNSYRNSSSPRKFSILQYTYNEAPKKISVYFAVETPRANIKISPANGFTGEIFASPVELSPDPTITSRHESKFNLRQPRIL
uniref:Uncharacterized protein n=1 Tax=Romanomermis culicivorax TaxID=13658 RepID=A0A915K0M9_ROMCU